MILRLDLRIILHLSSDHYILCFWVRPLLSFFEFIVKILSEFILFPSLIHFTFWLPMLWLLYLINCLFHYFFPEVFSCYFNWEWFCLFMLFNFLCLYEFRWSSYLAVLKGCLTRTVCSCFWWESCALTWMQVIFYAGYPGRYHLGRWWGTGDGGARAETGVGGTSPLLSGSHYPFGVGSDPKLLEKKPWGGAHARWLCSFKYITFTS